jgi:hypothetical protein
VNKRETSFEGLVGKLENGEDGIYNMLCSNKNIILTPKVMISERDVAEIPELKPLRQAISSMAKLEKTACGRRKYLIK